MKQKHILFYGLLALLGAGCSDQKEEFASYGEVQVTAGISAGSRVSFNEVANITYANWQDGDAITLSTASQGNLDYVASVSGTTITFSPEGTSLKDISGETVQACYPAGSISGGKVSLPETGTWSDDEPMPFAYAVSSIQNSKVNLQFKHIFSFLKLTVTPDMLADSTRTVAAVTVSTSSSEPLSAGAGDTFDFSTLTASTTNGGNSVRITTDTQVTRAGWTVYIPVLPQPAGADITLTLTDSEGATLYTLTKATPDTGFLAGNVYRVGTTVSFDTSYLIDGPTFNASIKELASDVVAGRGTYDEDSLIARVEFLTEVQTLPEKYITVSAADSPAPIYASFNGTDNLLTVFTPAKDMEVVDASYMFYRLKSLQTIDFGKFDINEKTTNTLEMFAHCSSLATLDVSNWETSNVTNMGGTFYGCSALTDLNVSNWETSNVTTMGGMFNGCSTLTDLNVSNWNTANVTIMSTMFYNCSTLTDLNVSNWETSNVTDMGWMFWGCSALSDLNVSNWNTEKVTQMYSLFCGCSSLTNLDVSNWNTSNVKQMCYTFYNCSALTALDVSKWDTSNVWTMDEMFHECSSLTTLDVSNWETGNVLGMDWMFAECSSLTTLDVSNWETGNVIGMDWMFAECSALTTLDVSNWDTSNVTTMLGMFYECSELTTLDVSNWDTSNVTNICQMFYECSSLTTLDVSNWDTSNITDMGWTFFYCEALKELDVSNWDTSNVTRMYSLFNTCSSLTDLDVSQWNTENVTEMCWMFRNLSLITNLDISNWETGNVTNMRQMFCGSSALTTLDISNWNTENVTNMHQMFLSCSSLTTLKVPDWNTSNVTDMCWMFGDCSSLTTLDMSNWNTENVVAMDSLFYYCPSLTSLDIANWTFDDNKDISVMFAACASTSQACKITATSEAKDFLLARTGTTSMNPDWFIWGDAESGGSSFDDIPKQEWKAVLRSRALTNKSEKSKEVDRPERRAGSRGAAPDGGRLSGDNLRHHRPSSLYNGDNRTTRY